jgi:hypothetical protein
MKRRKKIKKLSKHWWRNVAIWSVLLTVIGTIILAIQAYYTAHQTNLGNESNILMKETSKVHLNISYYLLDTYATHIIFSPWLNSPFFWEKWKGIGDKATNEVRKNVWEDLRLSKKPYILKSPISEISFTRYWNEIDKANNNFTSNSIIDRLPRKVIWKGIMSSNVIEVLDIPPMEKIKNYEYRKEGKIIPAIRIYLKGNYYSLVDIYNDYGCGISPGDIISPQIYSFIADISNKGSSPAYGLVIYGKEIDFDLYKINIIENFTLGKEWTISLPFPLEPGEHLIIYLTTVFSKKEPWETSTEPWFSIGPIAKINKINYYDQILKINLDLPIREYNLDNLLTVSGNVWIGSCPYIVFLNSSGKKIGERRFLVDAIGSDNRKTENIEIPIGSTKIVVEERDAEITFLEDIKIYTMPLQNNYRIIKKVILKQGDSYSIKINKSDSFISLTGYYEPMIYKKNSLTSQ